MKRARRAKNIMMGALIILASTHGCETTNRKTTVTGDGCERLEVIVDRSIEKVGELGQ